MRVSESSRTRVASVVSATPVYTGAQLARSPRADELIRDNILCYRQNDSGVSVGVILRVVRPLDPLASHAARASNWQAPRPLAAPSRRQRTSTDRSAARRTGTR